MLASFIVQMYLASDANAYTYGLSPANVVNAPTMDGLKDQIWLLQNYTVFPNIYGNLLKVYACACGAYIYFGLEYQTSVHAPNESFAIACSNAPPSDSSFFNNSILSYPIVKTVRIDGKSWDQYITNNPTHRASNWSDGNIIQFANSNASGLGNYSWYEIGLPRDYSRASGQDINWSWNNQYLIRIFYGTTYAGATGAFGSSPYGPEYGAWTTCTPPIILTMPFSTCCPPPPNSPSFPELTIFLISFFSMTGVILAIVGVYIFQSRKRVKRL